MASRITGGGSPEEARGVGACACSTAGAAAGDVAAGTFVGAIAGVEVVGAAATVGADDAGPGVDVDVVGCAAAGDAISGAGCAVSVCCSSSEATVDRENPAGVSGASAGASCDDAFAGGVVLGLALAETGCVAVVEDGSGAVVDWDALPFFLEATRPAEPVEVPFFEPLACAVNRPSKNANRGCDGEISRNL